MDNSFNIFDPAAVPPSPQAFVQYEENRRKDTDQRDAVQKKTFTKWINKHLLKAGRRIVDLFEGFKDGHNLLSLLEVLSGETLPRERGRMKFHQIQNVQIALEFLRRKGIRLVNIRSDEIVDGNPKLTLGLVWTIILHFQISDVVVKGQPEDITAKDALLLWSRCTTDGYPGVRVQDFDKSWRDGKAFLSIIHRNRPHLIDFRKVQSQTNKQNLELAFSIAEREFGVTRLLDPEDVDVPKPDEKSLITYISSLYDVFPDVPSVEQSVKDNERQMKLDEYKDLAAQFLTWLQETIMKLSQRDFPSTLSDMKSVMSDINRFRIEDVPQQLEIKKKLFRLFDDIQSSAAYQFVAEDELHLDNVSRLWNRFEQTLLEREKAIQQEIIKLERLQRLAEKIHRESKNHADSLSDIERRIMEEARRIDTLHPFEAKHNCDALDKALKNTEDGVKSLLRDVLALQDGRYANAESIYQRVSALQTKLSQLRSELYVSVLQKLISKSYVEEDTKITRRREVMTEVRLVENNPAFKHVQHCLNWVEAKQNAMEITDFGTDLSSVQSIYNKYQQEYMEVTGFKKEIEKCKKDRMNLSPDEQGLYTEWLSKVEVAYSLLNNNWSRRLKSLENLQDFMQAATQELIWLNEKEEVEVTRDWSSSRLNVSAVEELYKNLLLEMKSRETQFNSVQDRGNSLVLDRHPASKTIEGFMGEMQSQWSWLLQLSVCLEAHVKHVSAYFQYFEEAAECEKWMSRQADAINIRYSDDNQSVETLQTLLMELRTLSDQVSEYEKRVSSLTLKCRDIIPLKLRGQPVFSELRCRCLNTYKQPPLNLSKGEEIALLDNSQKIRWRVRTSTGQEDLIPSVCILIPPPNYEAIEYADRLKIQLDHLQSLFRLRKRKLQQSLVLGTISLIRNWDLVKFQSLDPVQRETHLKVLNIDAARLIAEMGEGDRETRLLRDRLNECNQHFQNLTAAVNDEETRKSQPENEFLRNLDSLRYQLGFLDQDLTVRTRQPLPLDGYSMGVARQQQLDWERALQNHEEPVDQLKAWYNQLGGHSSQGVANMKFIDEKWEEMITLGNAYAERLKLLDQFLTKMDSLCAFVEDQEVKLEQQEGMTSDPNALTSRKSDLQSTLSLIEQKQSTLDTLNVDLASLRYLEETSHLRGSHSNDIENLEKKAKNLTARWSKIKVEVHERLTMLSDCIDYLTNYLNSYGPEQQYISEMQNKINTYPPLANNVEAAKKHVQPAIEMYNSLNEHQHQIEAINRYGGLFMREAKIYEKRTEQFQNSLLGIDSAERNQNPVRQQCAGAEIIKIDLDNLNRQYIDQVMWVNKRLQNIKNIFSQVNFDIQFPMLLSDNMPLLRTFRAELTKRSSVLVDDDMQECFQHLADFEGYGGLQVMGEVGHTFRNQASVSITQQEVKPAGETLQKGNINVLEIKTMQSPVRVGMKFPQLPIEIFSNKVTSIAKLSDNADLENLDSANVEQFAKTLITVRQGCLDPKGTYLHVSAILDTRTGRKLNLKEAIELHVVDIKCGTVLDTKSDKRINIAHATANKLISSELQKQLISKCGIIDPVSGKECTLLEAMQKELFNPCDNTLKDPSSEKFIPMQEAVADHLVTPNAAAKLTGEGVTVTMFIQSQAVFTNNDLASATMRLGLSDVIEHGLYREKTGKVQDPITGSELTVLEAVENGIINPTKNELIDAETNNLFTLSEAVTNRVIDPELGLYQNKSNGQKLTLDEAYQKKFLNKALLLPKALHESFLLENGNVIEPQTGRVVSFKKALECGILDSVSKTIIQSTTGDILSVTESIKKGLLDEQGFVNSDKGRLSLSEAVDKGVVKFVMEELVLGKPCVKDSLNDKLLTLGQAFQKGIITSSGDFIDTASGRKILLKAAANQGFVDKNIVDKLLKDTSMKDSTGKNISLLKAIQSGFIIPEKAEIKDPVTGFPISLQQAAQAGIISLVDALTVLELLCPIVAQTTVITRHQPSQASAGIHSISVSDASVRGLWEKMGTFGDPNKGVSILVQASPRVGEQSQDVADSPVKSRVETGEKWMKHVQANPEITQELSNTGKATVESKIMKKSDNHYSFTQTVVTIPQKAQNVVTEIKHFNVKSVVDPRTKSDVSEKEAVHRGLLDVSKGLFIHPLTKEKMTIESALLHGFIRGTETGPGAGALKDIKSFSLTGVVHPKTGKRISIGQAIKEGILDLNKGIYNGFDEKWKPTKLKISEAVEKGFVLAEDDNEKTGSQGFAYETKTYQLKSVINPVTQEKLEVSEAIKQGLLDETKGIYIHPVTGEKLTIPESVDRKLIDADLVSIVSSTEGDGSKIITTKMKSFTVKFVVDPRTGETISVTKAIDEGILDSSFEKFINPVTGEILTLNEAILQKLVLVQQAAVGSSKSTSTESIHIEDEGEVTESNLIEEMSSETVTFSINSVIDPRTMNEISYDEAIRYGILDVSNGLYVNPITKESTPINDALEKDLIHVEVVSKVCDNDLFHSCVESSAVSSLLKKVTSVLDQSDGSEISLLKAVRDGIIDVEKGTYFDVNTIQNIPLEKALEKGYIKLSKTTDVNEIERMRKEAAYKESDRKKRHMLSENENGLDQLVDMKMEKFEVAGEKDLESAFANEILNYTTEIENKASEVDGLGLEFHGRKGVKTFRQQEMVFSDTLTDIPGSVSPMKSKQFELSSGMSFQQGVQLGLVDLKSGGVRDSKTGKHIPLNDAINKGIIDTNKTAITDRWTGDELTLKQCIDKGIIDKTTGKVSERNANTETFAIHQDFELKQMRKPLNLLDCVASGLYDSNTGMITNPSTQKSYTLSEAIEQNIVDGNLVSVLDCHSGEKMSLVSALQQGLIDGVSAEVILETGEKLPLLQAIQEEIVENIFNKDSATLYDTLSGTVVTLDKALTNGQIRSDIVKVIDTVSGEIVPLDVAFTKGLIDVGTGFVTDELTGNKMSPQEALQLGLLVIAGAPVLAGAAVFDAIQNKADVRGHKISQVKIVQGTENPANGKQSPHVYVNGITQQNANVHLPETENFQECIQQSRMTEICYKPGDRIQPLATKHFSDETHSLGYRAADQYSVQLADSYEKLVQDLHNELNWVSDVEQLLKDDQPVSDEGYIAQEQIKALKTLHDDVIKHQQPIRSLVYQSEQLAEHHQEELTPEQVTEFQNLESVIKTSYCKVQKTCEARVKHLSAAADELTKFESELKKFVNWLEMTEKELENQTDAVQTVDNVNRVKEQHKEMQDAIIAHASDLRYISYSVKIYMEQAKAHKLELDAYKADRAKPSRVSRTSWIALDNKEFEGLLEKQKDVENSYNNLVSQSNKFGEKLSQLVTKQKEFNDYTWGMLSWLTDTEETLSMTRQETSAPEPDALRQHLDKMKTIGNDTIAHKNQMAQLKKCGKEVIMQMQELAMGEEQINKIKEIVSDISGRHDIILEEVTEKANELQTAVTKSQGVQDAVEQLLSWLKVTDHKLDKQKPFSLNCEMLNEQAKQLNILETDIESHEPSIESVKQAANDLIKTCDLDMAQALKAKIKDIGDKFILVQNKCKTGSKEVSELSKKINTFNNNLDLLKTWVQVNSDSLESSDWSKKPVEQLKSKVESIKLEKDRQLLTMEALHKQGKELIENFKTSDTGGIRMALASLDKTWTKFDESLNDCDSEVSLKESKESDYERIKQEVVNWLTNMETDIDGFEPVAVDIDVVAKQIEELQPMIQSYYEFLPKVDELNDVGNAFEAVQAGDSRPKSPMRFRSRRIRNGILSPRLQSPSPTTSKFFSDVTSPMSASSESSGAGSGKSSSDYLHLDDLSETQQDLVDMNQRYEMLEERLLDRQQELQVMLDSVRSLFQDLADILSWLDSKQKELDDLVSVATSEKEAKRRLKEHERRHAEVLSKETMVDEIRKKGQDFIKRKHGMPGVEMIQEHLTELDDKWLEVKVASEQQRKVLEDIVTDLRTYKDAGVQLQKWIAQKEKMVAVLGPVATEPSMIKNQLEQVKVLQEEMQGQEPLYDKFIQSGNSVHDKCIPESKDAAHITEKMSVISKGWERLYSKLQEREKSLSSVAGLSQQFNDTLQDLTQWMTDYMTTLENLSAVTSSPEKHSDRLREIQELESERKKKIPLLEKAKDLAKKLSDNTKDANTKFEIKNKISNIEKPMAEAEKKLQLRSNEVSKIIEDGNKLGASCSDLVALLKELKDRQDNSGPLSGDANVLKQQALQNKDIIKDINALAHEIKAMSDKAKQFESSSSPALKSLADKVKTIQGEWESLRDTASQREQQLEASTKHAQNFQVQLDKVLLWLQLSESKLKGETHKFLDQEAVGQTPDILDQEEVGKKLKELQTLRGDMLKFSYDLDLLKHEGQLLMDSVDSDKDLIKVSLADVNQRRDSLCEILGEKITNLEDISSKLTEFDDCYNNVQSTLCKLEDKLNTHIKLGSSAKDPKYQDKIKALQDDGSTLDSQLDYLDGILKGLPELQGPLNNNRQVESAHQLKTQLQHQIQELLKDMEQGTQIVDQFQGAIKTFGSHVTELESELMNMSSVARDEGTLKLQERQIEEYISKVNDIDNQLDDLENQYKSLKADGYVTASDGLAAQLDMLRNQQEHMREVSEKRKSEISSTAAAVEAVADNLRRMRTSIDRAAEQLEMHEPIGHDVNAIRRLQDDLKQFQHGVLDSLSSRIQSVTDEAQQLIQGAAPGVNTSLLEADQENLLDKWNSLNAKMSERDRNLDNAILQSGKFNDALRNLLDWMTETEELVANQKSPSPDYKVAKSQLQEQKFLLKMLDDRSPSIKSVRESGKTLQKNLEARERQIIQNQIAQLNIRWGELNSCAQERSNTLENILSAAKKFQDVKEPLIAWLDATEKKFASLEPSNMDVDSIETIIKNLEDMDQDVKEKEEQIKKLATVGKELQNHCKGDDVKNVQSKIDDVQCKFAEVSDKLSDTLEQMEEALPIAKSFSDLHTKFIDWLVKMEQRTRQKDGNEPEEQVNALLEEIKDTEPLLQDMHNDGSALIELAPGDAGFKVEDMLTKDMKRFEAINEAIQNKADKFRASKLKNAEVMCTVDDLIQWFEEEEKLLLSCEPLCCEPSKVQKQLAEQKGINDDINAQKIKARDTIATSKRLLRESSMEDESIVNNKIETLRQKSDTVAKLGNARLVQLEQAMPLSKTFFEAHQDLLKWFQEVDPAIVELEVMSINQDTVKKQQDRVKVLKQDFQDNKPLIDKLNKTGLALTKLALSPDDLNFVQSTVDEDNKHVDEIRQAITEHSMSIDEALQQSAEFTDKLENMLEALTSTEEQITNAHPISAHSDKIREQIADNNVLSEEMKMRLCALESVQTVAEDLIKQASNSQDDAVKDVKSKLLELVNLYEKINDKVYNRNNKLEETLEVSDKFWDEFHSLNRILKELSDTLAIQEPVALEPSLIREQQDALEALRDDIEASQFDLDEVHTTGDQLLNLCGEPDKPEVQKNIDDLDTQLLTITGEFDKRSRILEEALEKTTYFQDELMKTLVWLQKREDRLRELSPVARDFDTIKHQWNEVKLFKSEVDPKHAGIELLNQKANELVKDSSPDQAVIVKEPVAAVNKRWDGLQEGISDRQRDLQLAMLNAGQFDHAINELLTWLDITQQTLEDNKPVYGDRKLIEIELAKHKVLQNDIHAHEQSVKSIKEAGPKAFGVDHLSASKSKIDDMTRLWNTIKEKSDSRQKELENALKEAKAFSMEMEKKLVHLGHIEGMLITSRPVGGLPETAREQLTRFMDTHKELQELEPTVATLLADGSRLMQKCQDDAGTNISQNLQLLQQTWEHIKFRAADRKEKLEQAENQANNFHKDLNGFIDWLTETEKVLNNMKPVSRVKAHVVEQIKDQKALQKDITVHRDSMIKLDKTGTHLKYFSQKQDVVLIKNLLSSVQLRWEKIVSRSAERTRHLERGYKEAIQFSEMLNDLITWLTNAEQSLNADHLIGNDPVKIKGLIAQHKEFQKSLGAKQPVYDTVNRAWRTLRERSPDEDIPVLQEMLHQLKNIWNSVCGKSVDRQRKLEEALLSSGQFSDALQALLDWLAKVEPGLGEDQMVHGDIDTVNNLVEEHKSFQQELGARTNNVAFVRKRARELLEISDGDTSQQQVQLIELTTMWDRVCKLSVNKQERLEQAQKLAEDFQKKANSLITWLGSAERHLRYKGAIPDDEGEIMLLIDDHKTLEEEFLRQEGILRETLNIGQDIMKRCHPDAVSTIKHWLSVLKARWEEVFNWSNGHGNHLRDCLATHRRNNQLLEELIAWLNDAETKLFNDNAEPIPDEVEIITDLIKEHQDFQNEMSAKQPEIDLITKGDKRRNTSVSGESVSHIPMYKGLSGRRTPTPVKFGYLNRRNRDDDGRRTPDIHFKNPRVGALHNKWRQVWLTSMDRHRKLQQALESLNELERMKHFQFDDWRKRYLTWMHHNKSRIMDFFRRQDKDRDGKVTRAEFINGIIASKFQTSLREMEAVANIFDRDGDGFIDYKEFVSALRPNRDTNKADKKPEPVDDSELIQDEVKRQVHKCTCVKQYRIHKIGEGKYRFGDSQKLRLVRILRSTVMVRVGGGWMALDEFLVKNDPCRARELVKGRTNTELREQFTLAAGVSQSMAGFISKSPGGSSYSGSSTYSGANSPYSTRSPSTGSGPITKVREKTVYRTPWRQNMARYGPDGEVQNILSASTADNDKNSRARLSSPRLLLSPGTPVGRSSYRTSIGSRPFSPTGSENSETADPEVFTTVQSETRNIGGRNETTKTFQTHVIQTRNVTTPTRLSASTPTRLSAGTPTRLSAGTPTRTSKIPKLATPKK